MPYKTISIKLQRPSKWKRDAIEIAMADYSLALETVLRAVRPRLPRTGTLSRAACLRLFDSAVMQSVDHLAVEPFKDSVKLEAYSILRDYLQKSHKLGRARRYPSIMATQEDLEEYFSGNKLSAYELNRLLGKYEKVEPLFFCRNSPNRDFSILCDRKTGTYYAKFYLFNRANAVLSPPDDELRLQYINGDKSFLKKKRKKVRFILVPLLPGDWQLRHIKEVEEGQAVLKSAILVRRKHAYFLNMKLWYEELPKADFTSYLGISRGVTGNLYAAAVDREGNLLHEQVLHESGAEIEWLNRLANRITDIALAQNSQIVLENLTDYQDKLRSKTVAPAISRAHYNALSAIIAHKVSFTSLPEPIRLSPRFIFYRCTNCGEVKNSNRLENVLLCLSCGSSMALERTGAYNLASAPMIYKKSKFKVICEEHEKTVTFTLPMIDYRFTCAKNHFAEDLFVNNLSIYIEKPAPHLSKKQLSIVQTLRKRSELKESLHFIEKNVK